MLLKLEKVSHLFICAYQGDKDDHRLTKRTELPLDKGDRKRERSLNFLQSSFLAHLAGKGGFLQVLRFSPPIKLTATI
jgi:hypothetical protein